MCTYIQYTTNDFTIMLVLPTPLPPGNHKTGSTGKVMAGAEMKIENPDENGDGEICFRGRHVFMGYLNEERKTREAIDDDGWLHSGDIGRVDQDG